MTVRSAINTLNHMVEKRAQADAVFHALAHSARRDMLTRLATGDLTVGQLAAPLPMSLAAAAKHVLVLERARLVYRTVQGRNHLVHLERGPLSSARTWLSRVAPGGAVGPR